jgi:integrase
VGEQEGERDRVLSEAEATSLPVKLEAAILLDSIKHGIWVMLGTLPRIGELTRVRTSDIDIDAGTWTIPAGSQRAASKTHCRMCRFMVCVGRSVRYRSRYTDHGLKPTALAENTSSPPARPCCAWGT